MSLDSNYLQRQLEILADDFKDDEPKVAKAYLFLKDRLYQSYPDGDVSEREINHILNEPQGRKHKVNLPDWAIDKLFENSRSVKKQIKESKITSWINKIITEELKKFK